jgi:hypothetical protein
MNLCEFIRCMNFLCRLCGCAAVQQCAAVQAAACGSAHGSVRAVHAIVCDRALGSAVHAAVHADIRQCGRWVAVGGSVWQCARQWVAVR